MFKKLLFIFILSFNVFASGKKCEVIKRMEKTLVNLDLEYQELINDRGVLDQEIEIYARLIDIDPNDLEEAKREIEAEMDENFDQTNENVFMGVAISTGYKAAIYDRFLKFKRNKAMAEQARLAKNKRYSRIYFPALILASGYLGYKVFKEDQLADENFKKVSTLAGFITRSSYLNHQLRDLGEQITGLETQLRNLRTSFSNDCE